MGMFITGGLFTFYYSTQAETNEYTVLAPLPGVGDTTGKTTLEKYLPAMFNIAIVLSAVFAVLMIVIGGFQYMSTDAIQGKSAGRERIKNAIFALVLVIGAWLILWTINPALLTLNLDISTVAPKGTLGGELSAATGNITPGYTLTAEQIAINAAMVKDLKDNYGINVNNNGTPCAGGEVSGCTNLVGMTQIAFKGVTDLKKACSDCNITISGGTEGGHASHGPNLPPMDLRLDSNLDQYILNNQVSAPQTITGVGILYTSKVGNRSATFLKEADHWHVVFE